MLRLWCGERLRHQLPEWVLGLKLPPDAIQFGDDRRLADRFGPEFQQGLTAEVRVPEAVGEDDILAAAMARKLPILALEEVQDPQNVGSLFRAAAALGAAGIVMTKHRSAPLSAAVLRASVGQAFLVPYARVGGMPNWLGSVPEVTGVAAVPRAGVLPQHVDFSEPTVIVLGAEGEGLKRLTVERCRLQVTIPMAAAESLNVAQTGAVLLYEALRQRLQGV